MALNRLLLAKPRPHWRRRGAVQMPAVLPVIDFSTGHLRGLRPTLDHQASEIWCLESNRSARLEAFRRFSTDTSTRTAGAGCEAACVLILLEG